MPRGRWTDVFAVLGGLLSHLLGVLLAIFGIFAIFSYLRVVFTDEDLSDTAYYARMIIGLLGLAVFGLGFWVRWLSIRIFRALGSPRLQLERVVDLIGPQPEGYAGTGRALLDLGSRPRKALFLLESIAKQAPDFAATPYLSAVAHMLLYEQEPAKDEHLQRASACAEAYAQRRSERAEALAYVARLTGEQAILAARRRDDATSQTKQAAANDLFARASTLAPSPEADPYVPPTTPDIIKAAREDFDKRLTAAREAAVPKPFELWTFRTAEGATLYENIDVDTARARLLDGSLPATALCRRGDRTADAPLLKSIASEEFKIEVLFRPVFAHVRAGFGIGIGVALFIDGFWALMFLFRACTDRSERSSGSGWLFTLGLMAALLVVGPVIGAAIGFIVGLLRAPRLRREGATLAQPRTA